MKIEYEAKFINIDKKAVRSLLKKIGAKLIHPEYLQKRYVWNFPKGHEVRGGWIRVRQEADKITMSVKVVPGRKLRDQREICLTVDNMENARLLLNTIGCRQKAYQETTRELWRLGKVDITIDEWPFLEPFVEIEGPSEKSIRAVAKKMNFEYKKAIFGSVDFQYMDKYGISPWTINGTPRIVFGMKNPFLKRRTKNE